MLVILFTHRVENFIFVIFFSLMIINLVASCDLVLHANEVLPDSVVHKFNIPNAYLQLSFMHPVWDGC